MNARAVALVAQDPERWQLAGDQLYLDLDISTDNLPPGTRLEFGGFWVNAADGFRFTSPRIYHPSPDVHVAQGYDFGDFAFVATGEGTVAIEAGTAPQRVAAALDGAGLSADQVTHVILTHSHFDHVGGIGALLGPGTKVIASAGFPA